MPRTYLQTSKREARGWIALALTVLSAVSCDVHGITSPGILSAIIVSPSSTTLAINGTQQFSAVATDFSGAGITVHPIWSIVSGGGTISTSGLFTAGTTPGTFKSTVKATSGRVSDSATIIVTIGPLATIDVTPTLTSMGIGATQQYVAVGKDVAGNVVTITPNWSVVAGGGTVNEAGLFTADTVVGTFTNTVEASSGGVSGVATATVTVGALATIAVSPTPKTLVVNGVQQFTAVGHDASGHVVVFTPIWSVENGGGSIGFNTGMFTAGTTVGTFANTVKAGGGGGITGAATVTVIAGTLATVTVMPNPVSVSTNATRQFTAVGHDASGNVVAMTPTWAVVHGGGSINASTGLFTAGTTSGTFTNTVKVTNGTISSFATVTVTAGLLATITVTPSSATRAIGTTQQFTAVGRDAGGNVVAITPTWAIVASGGTVDPTTGLFTAGATSGVYPNTVRARAGGVSGFATATVISGALATITVTPNPVSVSTNATRQFTAVGRDAGGNVVPITPTWSVISGGGAISASGLFTAGTTPGTFTKTVKATSGSVSDTATVTVTAGPLASITVTPTSIAMGIGAIQQYIAVGKDAAGNVVPITPGWSVVAGGGTVTNTGLFTAGTTPGTFTNTVQASSGGISGTATVTVAAGALATIAVTPNPTTLATNGTQQFIAVGRDANGNIVSITPAWSVENGGGSIDLNTGLFTAGTTAGVFTNTVRVRSGTVSGTATVTVTAGALATIVVTPHPDSLAPRATRQFLAVGHDVNGNVVTIAPIWSVVNGGGSINTSGLFAADTVAGTFTNTVRAGSGSISGTATVTVIPGPLSTITVTPNPDSILTNAIEQFSATGRDAYHNNVLITPIWTVVNGGGGINLNTGQFTAGAAAGTFINTVRAAFGAVSGFATVVETAPIPPPLVPLGLAEFNGIMAGTTVTCVDLSTVHADVSVSPGNTVAGFGPCVITGVQHLNDATAAQAQIDLTTAYDRLSNLPCPPANFILTNLGGMTKAAGVYCSATSIGVTGTLTLDGNGDPNATFVFQAGTTLTTAGNIVLINGAQAKNVYWLVGSSATIGTGSQWQGNIIAFTSITLVNNATIVGRALARQGAVTLGTSNVITLP